MKQLTSDGQVITNWWSGMGHWLTERYFVKPNELGKLSANLYLGLDYRIQMLGGFEFCSDERM